MFGLATPLDVVLTDLSPKRPSPKQKSLLFVCKVSVFVNQMFGDFAKMALTRVIR